MLIANAGQDNNQTLRLADHFIGDAGLNSASLTHLLFTRSTCRSSRGRAVSAARRAVQHTRSVWECADRRIGDSAVRCAHNPCCSEARIISCCCSCWMPLLHGFGLRAGRAGAATISIVFRHDDRSLLWIPPRSVFYSRHVFRRRATTTLLCFLCSKKWRK